MPYLLFDFWRTIIDPPDLNDYYRYRVKNLLKVENIDDPEIEGRAFEFYIRLSKAFDRRRRMSCREIPATLEVESFLSFLGIDAVSEEHMKAYASPMIDLTILKPGVKESLEDLSSKYRMAVVSNTPYHDMIVVRMEKDGLLNFFDAVVSSHRTGVRKPVDDIFLTTLEVIGGRPKEAIMVGDSPYEDIMGAKRLGMKTIWMYKEGVTGPNADGMIKSFLELPSLLKVMT